MCTGRSSNQEPLGPKFDALTTAPLRHLNFKRVIIAIFWVSENTGHSLYILPAGIHWGQHFPGTFWIISPALHFVGTHGILAHVTSPSSQKHSTHGSGFHSVLCCKQNSSIQAGCGEGGRGSVSLHPSQAHSYIYLGSE